MTANRFAELQIGQRITAERTFGPADITAAAKLIGDENFLHHDPDRAAGTRFGGLIASGGHTVGVMGAVVATYFGGDSLGLELACQMLGPVRAGDTISIEWVVIDLEAKPHWDGGIVTLRGEGKNRQGETVLAGDMKVLVSPQAIAGRPVSDAG